MFLQALTALLIVISGQLSPPVENVAFFGNLPKCNAVSSGREPNVIPDTDRQLPTFELYCDAEDQERQGDSYLISLLRINQGHFDQVDGLFWAVADRTFSRVLCSALSPSAVHVRLFVGGSDSALRPLLNCSLASAHKSVRSVPLFDGLSSFHPKFLAAVADNESWTYVSSGNPTTRSATVVDFNVLFRGSATSQLYLWHRCVVQIFERFMAFPQDEPLKGLYQQCRLPSYSTRDASVVPYLMPFDQDAYLAQLAFWAGRSDEIDISSQSYNSDRILEIIRLAADNGAKVRYLRDDDILLSTDPTVAGLANSYDEHILWDRQLCGLGVSRRYLLTKPGSSFLHSKFFIFRGSFGIRVLFGSGNLTYSAITDNLENNYFSSDEEVALGFAGFFDKLWQVSVDYDHWRSIAEMLGSYRGKKWVDGNDCAKRSSR
ncbi:phospholipase D-like domain-containing protein [Devosia aquimaris]|uniref:phospholipase D-like domain-containing protein n=1 Tax=Devosia aquimaris TaxID=2866214 RepID=UPI001CD0ADBB|nr:phospholipase D-like domain-containing protein [Devosia sp. CJK-A8-3]